MRLQMKQKLSHFIFTMMKLSNTGQQNIILMRSNGIDFNVQRLT